MFFTAAVVPARRAAQRLYRVTRLPEGPRMRSAPEVPLACARWVTAQTVRLPHPTSTLAREPAHAVGRSFPSTATSSAPRRRRCRPRKRCSPMVILDSHAMILCFRPSRQRIRPCLLDLLDERRPLRVEPSHGRPSTSRKTPAAPEGKIARPAPRALGGSGTCDALRRAMGAMRMGAPLPRIAREHRAQR